MFISDGLREIKVIFTEEILINGLFVKKIKENK
jgi:hypothetical protein